jgi:hypothetical protein
MSSCWSAVSCPVMAGRVAAGCVFVCVFVGVVPVMKCDPVISSASVTLFGNTHKIQNRLTGKS